MKKINVLRIVMAFAAILIFAQCANNVKETASQNTAPATTESAQSLKIAYVDIDSLLNNYKFSVTLRNEMLRKGENMRMTLSEKAKVIQADMEDFQRKMENNVYATRQRAEEEQTRILKSQEDYARLEQRLVNELSAEEQKNNLILRDSINNFLKDYNVANGYDLILSRMADNILLANEALDITKEVIDGLNDRYAGSDK
ncbi:MAG: OmpH family outer membrane protein [Bacteroidaceae bacterium]|nr:OmpH family outer membrane protein [Bacteroidaceae bacterium]MBQ3189575.1 OmpH family outer membrane protein [Bacteroidaceae bacterium]